MSGGHFDYEQYKIDRIANDVEEIIKEQRAMRKSIEKGDEVVRWGYIMKIDDLYSDKTIAEFKKGLCLLKKAAIYAQRIDWLVSDDDGEESFHKRLKENLDKM